jgi:TonB-like protein
MSLAQCTRSIATTFLGLMSIQVGAMAQQAMPPASCPVTLPSPGKVPAIAFGIGTDTRVAAFGKAQLWTVLPLDGTWRGFLPTRAGDYAYSNKLPWGGTFSYKDGPLIVTGKRLDGPAPSFTEIEPISWKREFMGGINIPVFGCWQVTGKYKDQELQFVVWVTPIQQQTKQISQDVEPKSAPRRVRLNSEIEAESLVYRVTPETPHEAKVANISGTVVLDAVIGIDGRPHNLRYVSGPLILAQAAIDAVTWWEYRINDLDVEVDTTIPVVFSAED